MIYYDFFDQLREEIIMEQQLDQILPIPEDYICPITQDLMEDPVVAADGNSYELQAITEWLQLGKRISPITGDRLAHTNLIPNVRLKAIIQDFKQKLPKIQLEQQIKTDLELAIQLREEEIALKLDKQINFEKVASEKNDVVRMLDAEKNQNEELNKKIEIMNFQMQQMKVSMQQMSLLSSNNNSNLAFFQPSSLNLINTHNNIDNNANYSKYINCDLAELKFLAQKEDVNAQALLGRIYLLGIGDTQNLSEAKKWLSLAVKNLDTLPGLWAQGLCYEYGIEIPKSEIQAVKYYQKAAEKGYAPAQSSLGFSYYSGNGLAKNGTLAVQCFHKAVQQGYVAAECNLGLCYDNGVGVEKDQKMAVQWYQKAAEQGYAPAQFNLGICYERGTGVEKSQKLAIQWYRKGAEQGYAPAQFNLGLCYENGVGVERDQKLAVQWYQKAAEQEYVAAQCNLGRCYRNGNGTVKDEKLAVQWFQKAIELEQNANAQFNLGVCYENGMGVKKDKKLAVEWYQRAANQNNVNAQINLGWCYQNGSGVKKDEKEAAKWYQKAAEQGNATAQFNLGWCYHNGSGLIKNERLAAEWYQKAAEQGDIDAKNALKKLAPANEPAHRPYFA